MATDLEAGNTTTPTTKTPIPRSAGVGKGHLGGIIALMAVIDLVIIGLAIYVVDKLIDGTLSGTNSATLVFAVVAILAAMITLAAIIAGFLHSKHYNSGSLSSASTTALIAWVVTLLAFVLAWKHVARGHVGSTLKALEAFVIILAFIETLYVLILHAGLFNSKFGVGY